MLAASDAQHLRDAGFVPGNETRMRFYPRQQKDRVSPDRMCVEVNIQFRSDAGAVTSDPCGVDLRMYRATDSLFRDLQRRKHSGLTSRSCAAVASHCREDEGQGALVPEPGDDLGDDDRKTVDPAGPHTDGHGTSRQKLLRDSGCVHGLADRSRNIVNRVDIEAPPHPRQRRQGHVTIKMRDVQCDPRPRLTRAVQRCAGGNHRVDLCL